MEILIPISNWQPDYPVEPKNLGQRLTKIRMDLGVNRKEVALRAGIDEQTLMAWELHGRRPTRRNFTKLIETFREQPTPKAEFRRDVRDTEREFDKHGMPAGVLNAEQVAAVFDRTHWCIQKWRLFAKRKGVVIGRRYACNGCIKPNQWGYTVDDVRLFRRLLVDGRGPLHRTRDLAECVEQ